MADESPKAISEDEPRAITLEQLEDCEFSRSVMIQYSYHGVVFNVLLSSNVDDHPQGYDWEQSIEGKLLIEFDEESYGTPNDERFKIIHKCREKLVDFGLATCSPLFREMAPRDPLPKPRTLQEQLYPPSHTLQILTEDGKPACHKIDYKCPEHPVPLTEGQLQELALRDETPVYHPSKVVLISHIKCMVWKVEVDGEVMICKVSRHPEFYGHTLANELGTYQKIGRAGDELKLPKLKGVVKSHAGIIAMLLSYIPNKHHNLRWILDGVKEGRLPKTEATTAMRTKWAEQIKNSVARLHELGMLWHDVKTDNVLQGF